MISVIVPVYNAERYIGNCIESLLGQTYRDFELLLINDGSSDRSDEICRIYAERDERIWYFYKNNEGVGATRNFGIEKAKGDWICFVDADDEVVPTYLEAFDVDNSAADIIMSGIRFVNITDGLTMREVGFKNERIERFALDSRIAEFLPIGFPYGKSYRKKFLVNSNYSKSLHFPTDISFHEDHVFCLDCYLKMDAIETKEAITYLYKIDYSNASLSKKKHSWQNLFTSALYMADRLQLIKLKYGLSDDCLQPMYTFIYEPVIGAVYALYEDASSYDTNTRRMNLKKLVKGELDIRQMYYPTSKKGKLIKFLSTVLPVVMLDLFFHGVNKYQHRAK